MIWYDMIASELSSGKGLLENVIVELCIGKYIKRSKKASTSAGVTRWYQQFEEQLFSFPLDDEFSQVWYDMLYDRIYVMNKWMNDAIICFFFLWHDMIW